MNPDVRLTEFDRARLWRFLRGGGSCSSGVIRALTRRRGTTLRSLRRRARHWEMEYVLAGYRTALDKDPHRRLSVADMTPERLARAVSLWEKRGRQTADFGVSDIARTDDADLIHAFRAEIAHVGEEPGDFR